MPAAPIVFGPDEQSRSISLALAPNGEQYTHHGANFTYLALTLATELCCRFGHAAGGSVLATVAATSVFLGACVSPPLTAPGAIPLGLSLNGQQFYDFETFTSYAPAQPSRPSEPPSMAASRSPSSAPASAAASATAPATLVRPSCLPPTTRACPAARCCDAACLRPMPPAFARRSPFAATIRRGSMSSCFAARARGAARRCVTPRPARRAERHTLPVLGRAAAARAPGRSAAPVLARAIRYEDARGTLGSWGRRRHQPQLRPHRRRRAARATTASR